ncbi:MAG TPA: HAMP domain-containing sensor histidine kinase [Candidatus Dormibacteraeota bacterium]|nr:HAMP domain-containing sensor histidine kinase [Candidatus Dormibacteraeota bacterium]
MGDESSTCVETAPASPERWSTPAALLRTISDSDLLRQTGLGITLVGAHPSFPLLHSNEGFRRSSWAVPDGVAGEPLSRFLEARHRRVLRDAHRKVVRTGLPTRLPATPERGEVELFPLRWGSTTVTHVLGLWEPPVRRTDGRNRQGAILRALGLVGGHLGDGRGMGSFLGRLSRALAELVGASGVAFWRYDPERRLLSLEPEPCGFPPGRVPRLISAPLDAGGRVAPEEAVVWSRADPGSARASAPGWLLEALGARDAVVAPWKAGDRRLGLVVACDARRPGGFTEEDAWTLQAAAAAAALVVEHRQADDALTAARDREAERLRRQVERSIQLEQMKTNLLRLVSHELRTPLTVLRGYLSMIEDGSLRPRDLPSVLSLLQARVEEMGHLIDEIVEAARLEDSAMALSVQPVDLREVVTTAVRTLEPLAGPDHPLRLRMPRQRVPVKGDHSRLAMILTALIHNAIKYSPEGGEIRVDCRLGARTAAVAVSDRGVGIARRDRPRLFTRFGRIVTPETKHIPGTGLGLYLARDLARRHGGDIRVRSTPGRGSTFTLRLPLSTSDGETGAAA